MFPGKFSGGVVGIFKLDACGCAASACHANHPLENCNAKHWLLHLPESRDVADHVVMPFMRDY